ncbi:hypothetical protein MAPG_07600 [Magnaporthiopsis poae ATCC 64411]|uniref:DUF6590 domain-containing protein n=1 Tax=Magnaporthiopsis poae (strain ATCC 64411 / 73-15) TaxID=644358 RepID=A0A0C4E539_MAGP6|nr:hypothetical protein MAPG_07600 [Magnaporthiopsis poae ATCC 64411]
MAPTTRSVSVRLNGRAMQHVPSSVHAPLNKDHRITKPNATPKPFFTPGNRDSVTPHSSSSSSSTSPENKPEDDDELEEGEIREYGKSSRSSETTLSPRRSPLWDAIHAWEALRASQQSSSSSSSRSSYRQRWDFEVVDRSRCLPGIVFETAYHTAMASSAGASADNLTETTRGYVYTKYRKFVILEKHATHIQALPIYTHNGTGLDRKRQFEHEFVCVRDRDCPADKHEPEEGVHGTLFGIREPGFKATFIGGRAVLKLTEMVSFSIHASGGLVARVEGRLEDDSLRKLACLVHSVRAKRLEDVFLQGGGGEQTQRPREEVVSKLARENHCLKTNMILVEANHKTAVMQEQRENERLKRRIEQLEAEVAKLRGQTTEGNLSPKWAKLDF